MDYLFQDARSEIIRRELVRPKAAVIQELSEHAIVTPYVKLTQLCFGNIVGDGVPGTTCQQNPSTDFNAPNYDPQEAGGFDPGFDALEAGNPDEDILEHEKLQCSVEQYIEQDIDEIAQTAASMIRENKDWRRVEYGFLIYSGPNGLRLGAITRGNSTGVDIPLELREDETLAGRVHNHPRNGVGAPSDIDRDAAASAVREGFTDQTTFSDYILNCDDRSLNEYDFPLDYSLEEPNEETSNDAKGKCK